MPRRFGTNFAVPVGVRDEEDGGRHGPHPAIPSRSTPVRCRRVVIRRSAVAVPADPIGQDGAPMTLLPLPAEVSRLDGPAPDLARGLRLFECDPALVPCSSVSLRTWWPTAFGPRGRSCRAPDAGHADGTPRWGSRWPWASTRVVRVWTGPTCLRAGEGRGSIEAPAPDGIFRGLTTLRQLMAAPPVHAVVIADGPRFAWRGLSLDVVRSSSTSPR